MKNYAIILVTALIMVSCIPTAPVFGQSNVTQETDKHPYDYALDYCSDRGGLAVYTVSGSVVRFSCADEIHQTLTIETDE